ncbi:hypothetical protein C8Q76DRAFT_748587 [Earliella scabrosa]|nr:hypothetical protein C8Q76DRAFT_748587 [Earliella scabrosa]
MHIQTSRLCIRYSPEAFPHSPGPLRGMNQLLAGRPCMRACVQIAVHRHHSEPVRRQGRAGRDRPHICPRNRLSDIRFKFMERSCPSRSRVGVRFEVRDAALSRAHHPPVEQATGCDGRHQACLALASELDVRAATRNGTYHTECCLSPSVAQGEHDSGPYIQGLLCICDAAGHRAWNAREVEGPRPLYESSIQYTMVHASARMQIRTQILCSSLVSLASKHRIPPDSEQGRADARHAALHLRQVRTGSAGLRARCIMRRPHEVSPGMTVGLDVPLDGSERCIGLRGCLDSSTFYWRSSIAPASRSQMGAHRREASTLRWVLACCKGACRAPYSGPQPAGPGPHSVIVLGAILSLLWFGPPVSSRNL